MLARFAFDSVNPYEHMVVSVRLGPTVLSDTCSILFKSLKKEVKIKEISFF